MSTDASTTTSTLSAKTRTRRWRFTHRPFGSRTALGVGGLVVVVIWIVVALWWGNVLYCADETVGICAWTVWSVRTPQSPTPSLPPSLPRGPPARPSPRRTDAPPRVVYWDDDNTKGHHHVRIRSPQSPPSLLFTTPIRYPSIAYENRVLLPRDDFIRETDKVPLSEDGNTTCLPLAEWQTQSFPNCNLVHEISLLQTREGASLRTDEGRLSKLGEGWFRTTWKYEHTGHHDTTAVPATDKHNRHHHKTPFQPETVVLKTLRIVREFEPEYYELHRRDAVAMERLTHSDYVVNVYGYCGQSAVNEYANFPFGGVANLEDFDRRVRGKHDARAMAIKLRLGASVALGVAHIHQAGTHDPYAPAGMVHYDLNPRNVALFAGGIPKINDFNIAEFLTYNPATNRTCGFPGRMHQPWWRAPEEVGFGNASGTAPLLDEMVDVYALGNLLFHVLTTHAPRGKMKAYRMDEVREVVARGDPPVLMGHFATSKDPVVRAFRKAMDLCFAKRSEDRGTAYEVAIVLLDALKNTKTKHRLPHEQPEEEEQEPDPVVENEEPDDESDDESEDVIEPKG